MTTRRLVAVSAGLGQPSATRLLADRLVDATVQRARDGGDDVEVTMVELREHAQDLANNLLTGFPSPRLRTTVDAVLGADALIVVSPIFNATYSGLFKLFFDVIERDALAGKPVLLAATGGTTRHSLALEHAFRPLFAYLAAATVPTAVYAAAEDWGSGGDAPDGGLAARIERAAGELAAALAGRPAAGARNPFMDPVPFESLLSAVEPRRPAD